MGYYQARSQQSEPDKDHVAVADRYLPLFIRGVGLLVMMIGFLVAMTVIREAWALYKTPHHVARLADAIEKGSNLDRVLSPFTSAKPKIADERLELHPAVEPAMPDTLSETFRITYFIAWIIVLVILSLIGRIAIAAIKTGGELALYDLEVKQFAKTVLKEAKRANKN